MEQGFETPWGPKAGPSVIWGHADRFVVLQGDLELRFRGPEQGFGVLWASGAGFRGAMGA